VNISYYLLLFSYV